MESVIRSSIYPSSAVKSAFPNPNESCISISGVTSTVIANRELDPAGEHIYRAFGENIAFEQERFLQSLALTGDDLSRVAVLSEAGTFGLRGGLGSDAPQRHSEPHRQHQPRSSSCGDPVKPQLSNLLQPSAVRLRSSAPFLFLLDPTVLHKSSSKSPSNHIWYTLSTAI